MEYGYTSAINLTHISVSNPPGSTGAYPSNTTQASSADSAPVLQENWSYEVTVRQVEAIMSRIESGELELAEVFDQFAAAVQYLHQCEAFLAQRQRQMDLLIETLTDDPEF